jgi:FtsH-binding integral membrane protein
MAAKNLQPHYRQRNPYTHESHRRQAFWQIYFPLLVFLLLVLTGAVFVIAAPAGQASRYSATALIYMIMILMVFGLFFILFAGASIFTVRQGLKVLPYYMFRAQDFFHRVNRRIKLVSNKSVEPVLRIRSAAEGVRALGRAFRMK